MRFPLFAVLLAACGSSSATDEAPAHPGVGPVDATTFAGDAFVPDTDDLVFVEEQTGSRFNLVGQAFEGTLADDSVQLSVLPAVTAFWFAWSTHHPGARVWNHGVANEGEAIGANSECGVPCEQIISGCFGGKDCIPSIDAPDWVAAENTSSLSYLTDDDRVLGLARGAAARAYPLDALWTHEIVNDTWDGWQFSVTYCPLTGSGVLVDGEQEGEEMRFGVSGNLFNSNLVMYDRATDSLYGQMRMVGFQGERLGAPLDVAGLIDTTWGQWSRMYPHSEVLGSIHASSYPYGNYRTDDTDTFMDNDPRPDPAYGAKSYAIGLIAGGETTIYPFDELQAELGDLGVVSDEIGGVPVLVAWDARGPTAVVFSRLVDGSSRSFVAENGR